MGLAMLREQARGLNRDQRNAFVAAWLGWAMDAFDYFLLVFVLTDVADTFNTSKTHVAVATTLTLAARPVGAAIFGYAGDTLRPPADAARLRALLLDRRLPDGVLHVADHAARAARAVRHRHGRRVGARRVAGHGEDPRRQARLLVRRAPAGLPGRLPVRGDRVLRRRADVRLARAVHLRRDPGAARAVHPHARRGVRGLGGHARAPEADQGRLPPGADEPGRRPAVRLPRAADGARSTS